MRLQVAIAGLLLMLTALFQPVPVRAQQQAEQETVDIELVLAADVSLSMDMKEREFQRNGYIQALSSPQVMKAITSGLWGRIAITYVEWAGDQYQQVIAPWTLIEGPQDMAAFTDKIAFSPSHAFHRTSISAALLRTAAMFDNNGFRGLRRVIDVSGDGPNNQGIPVTTARDELTARGITINGLPVMIREPGFGLFDIYNLDLYYEQCVIGGANAFIMPAVGWDEFSEAVRRKLVLEIAGLNIGPRVWKAQATAKPNKVIDCLVGEKMWKQRRWQFNEP